MTKLDYISRRVYRRPCGKLTVTNLPNKLNDMKKLYFILLLIAPHLIFGQTYELPDIIPPSPQAGEFIKYIDFPMDLSSGLPSINIPIYTIKSKELSVPISLSYHASGLKPNEDESGIVGLGWHLNAFGIVSRTINKQPDEKFWDYLIPLEQDISSIIENGRNPDAEILDNIVEGYHAESTPDIFNYTLPNGGSGKFVFKRSTVLSEFLNPVTLPFKPVKIVPDLSGGIFNYFEIKDENGVLYRFGKSISTYQEVYEKYNSYTDLLNNGITSWLLTEIISADKSDTIYFEYDDVLSSSGETGIFKSNHTFTRSASVTQTDPGIIDQRYDQGRIDVWSGYNYTQKRITKIRFKSGTVNFIYKSNIYPNHLLERIEIHTNGSSSPLQTIRFSQTKYHDSPELLNWYKLDELGFYDANNIKVNKYNFLYDTSSFPSIDYSGIDYEQTYSVDFWGYYNGKWNNDLMPSFDWTCPFPDGPNLFGAANRNPNYQFAKAGVLTQVTNPTGGETIYEYEGNSNYSNEPVGGIRIKSITHVANGKEIKRSFDYWGISKPVISNYFVSHNASTDFLSITDNFTASAEPNCNININGNPVLYTKVTEYLGEKALNKGWIEHIFDGSFIDTFVNYHYLGYNAYPWIVGGVKYSYGPLLEYYNGIVPGNIFEKETKVFNVSGNPVKTTKKYYSHTLTKELKGLNVSRVVNIPDADMFLKDRVWFYHFYNYKINQLSQKLDSTVTIHYSAGMPLTTREEYTYNNNLFITERKSQESDGSWIISKYKYPNDFASQAPYDDMANNRNIISPVVEQLDYQGTTPLQFIKTNYKNWGNNIIAPGSVEAKTGTNLYETRMRYHSYDNMGNVLSVSKDEGPKISYLWGYNHTFPIAKALNATETQIAYTSFENFSEKGGWSYTHSASSQKKTGNYSFQGTSLSKSGLPSGYYSVGYWAKKSGTSNGTVTINGSPTTISESNWEYKEYTTSGTLNNISISLSGVYIDELRLHPNDAQMTTYTYDPLIGITSKTDPNGFVTWYEYDNFNRLRFVKDHEGNILQTYGYKYALDALEE